MGLVDGIVLTAVKAVAPIARKKIEEGYELLKKKAEESPKLYDDAAVYLVGVALGIEGQS